MLNRWNFLKTGFYEGIKVVPSYPSATVGFAVGAEGRQHQLTEGDEQEAALGSVSVFDSQCAAVYLSEKTDVAFRPFGLDLFDKLSEACEAVRTQLERERKELERRDVRLPELPKNTDAFSWVSTLTSLSEPEHGKKLGHLSSTETTRIRQIPAILADLQVGDPQKTGQALNLRASRVERFVSVLRKIEEVLHGQTIRSLFESRNREEKAHGVVRQLQSTAFGPGVLDGTGSDGWRQLWEEARHFSGQHAYPLQDYPFVGDGALCVLCQQELETSAKDQLRLFEEYVQSDAQQELREATDDYQRQIETIGGLVFSNGSTNSVIDELRIENEELAESLKDELAQAETRREVVLDALKTGKQIPSSIPTYAPHSSKMEAEAQALRDRARILLQTHDQNSRETLEQELQELEARQTLGKNLELAVAEIDRKKQLTAYEV